MHCPLISVVIPTYNQKDYLPFAIDSVLEQSYSDFELILLDDGSTDETSLLIRKYQQKDPRILWITQTNQGPSAARNYAIQLAKGKYIALLDGDDIMDRERLAKQLHFLQYHPETDIIYTSLHIINETGQNIGEMKGEFYAPQDFLALMLFRNLIPGPSTIMTKKEILQKNPYQPFLRHAEDYELMVRLASTYRFSYLDLPLTSYRRHSNNLSNNWKAHRETEQKVLQRFTSTEIKDIVEKTSFSSVEKELLLAKILYNQNNFLAAMPIFTSLYIPMALFYLGNCQLYLSWFTESVSTYQNALNDSRIEKSLQAVCWNNLGVAYYYLKQKGKAIDCFQEALKIYSHYVDAKMNLQEPCPLQITRKELRNTPLPYSFGK